MSATLSLDEELALLMRGVAQAEPRNELRAKLERSRQAGKPLRVKYGIDPTGIDVHLGHTVPLRKLRQFQELGHQAVLIIGDATAAVGDPSGRDETRKSLTTEQIAANARDYLTQVGRVIDLSRAEVRHNGEWFGRFGFASVLSLLGKMTVQRMLERDDFSNRVKAGTPIYLHECLYPLMQGHDSVEIRADVELGGTEQLFNLMVGRHLQQADGQEPQVAMTMPILRGTDGERKMGKSLGNYVGINFPAYEMFAKTMSVPDHVMREWFELLTDRPADEIGRFTDAALTHPMEAKKTLGRDVVAGYHSPDAPAAAQAEWEHRFSQRQDPTDMPEAVVPGAELAGGAINPCRLLVLLGFAESNSAARRLIEQGGVTVGPERVKLTDSRAPLALESGLVVRVGSKKVARVKVG